MKSAVSFALLIALGLSWLWFWTAAQRPPDANTPVSGNRAPDTVTVWLSEVLGSPDEAYYLALEELWNNTHTDVKMKMAVMSYSGYESKLRIAMASGQPPDVCLGGMDTLESLKYTGKAPDLAVPIPPTLLPQDGVDAMGEVVKKTILRDGRPTLFPIYRYCYGGVIMADLNMLSQAGLDDAQLRKEGWTIDRFRETAKRMTRDLDGDGKPDTWGFGAARTHLNHLFFNEFGPGVWGREVTQSQLLARAPSSAWALHPHLTEECVRVLFRLFHQLVVEDKSWNPACLGMNWNEILDEMIIRRRLGMTFGETPSSAMLHREVWQADKNAGAKVGDTPPDLCVIWMPTLKPGDRPAPRAGVMGFSVFKQTPYKGDAHTDNALQVAAFITHPTHLARTQLRRFRHLPPNPGQFNALFPELAQQTNPWIAFYNEVMDSDVPYAADVLSADDPATPGFLQARAALDRWIEKEGVPLLEQVIYDQLAPDEGAHRFHTGMRTVVENAGKLP